MPLPGADSDVRCTVRVVEFIALGVQPPNGSRARVRAPEI
jgi:hypothetical protein